MQDRIQLLKIGEAVKFFRLNYTVIEIACFALFLRLFI